LQDEIQAKIARFTMKTKFVIDTIMYVHDIVTLCLYIVTVYFLILSSATHKYTISPCHVLVQLNS